MKIKKVLSILIFAGLIFALHPCEQVFAGWTWEGKVWICKEGDECLNKGNLIGDENAITDTFFPAKKGDQLVQLISGNKCTTRTPCNDENNCMNLQLIEPGYFKESNLAKFSCGGADNSIHGRQDILPSGADSSDGVWWLVHQQNGGVCHATADANGDGLDDCLKDCYGNPGQQSETIYTDWMWIESPAPPPTANFSGKCDPAVQTWNAGTSFSFELSNISPQGEQLESSTLFMTFLEGDGLNEDLEKNIMSYLGTPKWNENLGNNQWARSYPLITHTQETENLDDNRIIFNINANTQIQNQGGTTRTISNLMTEVESILGSITDNPGPFQTKYENLQVTDPYTFTFGANLEMVGREKLNWAGNGVLVDLRPNVCAEPPENTPTPTNTPSPSPTIMPEAPQCHMMEMLDDQGNILSDNDDENLQIGETVYFNCYSDKELSADYHFAFRIINEDCQPIELNTHHNQDLNNAYRYTLNRSGRFGVQCAVCNSQNVCDWEGLPNIPACNSVN